MKHEAEKIMAKLRAHYYAGLNGVYAIKAAERDRKGSYGRVMLARWLRIMRRARKEVA